MGSNPTTSNPTTSNPTTSKNPTKTPTYSPTNSPICHNKKFSQCGGTDYVGQTCCPGDLTCTVLNHHVSLCWDKSVIEIPCTVAPTSSPITTEQLAEQLKNEHENLFGTKVFKEFQNENN